MKNITLATIALAAFFSFSAQARPFSADISAAEFNADSPVTCPGKCNIYNFHEQNIWFVNALVQLPGVPGYPGLFVGGGTFSNPTNEEKATPQSQAACQSGVEDLCRWFEVNPQPTHCGAIRLSGGSGLLRPVTVRCN